MGENFESQRVDVRAITGSASQATLVGLERSRKFGFILVATIGVATVYVGVIQGSTLIDAMLAGTAFLAYGFYSGWNWAQLGLRLKPRQDWQYWIKVTAILGLIVGAVSGVVFGFCWATGLPFYVPRFDPRISEVWDWGVSGCTTVPVVEEGVFRFALCVPLARWLGATQTIAISGMVFALAHFVGGNPGPDNFVAGYLLAWAFLKSGTLLVPIILHGLGNLCVFIFGIVMYYYPII